MNVPTAILAEVVRQQELMGWPEFVPAYAEIRKADGHTYFDHHENLTVGDCEQLSEQYHRKSLKALETWKRTGTVRSLRAAGKSILYARLYRCRYLQLTGKTDSAESDMPMPLCHDHRAAS